MSSITSFRNNEQGRMHWRDFPAKSKADIDGCGRFEYEKQK
jgi:hypothetical protein